MAELNAKQEAIKKAKWHQRIQHRLSQLYRE